MSPSQEWDRPPRTLPLSMWTLTEEPESDPNRRTWHLTNADDLQQVFYRYAHKSPSTGTWRNIYGDTVQCPDYSLEEIIEAFRVAVARAVARERQAA